MVKQVKSPIKVVEKFVVAKEKKGNNKRYND